MDQETIKKIEQLKQESRELTKEGKIKEATEKFGEAWDLQFESKKVSDEKENIVEAVTLAKEGLKCLYEDFKQGNLLGNPMHDLHAIAGLAGSILIANAIEKSQSHFHIAKPDFLVGVDMGDGKDDTEEYLQDFEVKGKADDK